LIFLLPNDPGPKECRHSEDNLNGDDEPANVVFFCFPSEDKMKKSQECQIMISLIPHYFNETLKRLIAGTMALLTVVATCLPSQPVIAYTYDTMDSTESAETETVDYATTEDSDFDASKVAIVAEVEDLRTIDTKTFLKEDGTYVTAVYAEPVHYLVNEKYEDIDNTLSFDAESGVYSTKANAFGVQFPDSLDADQTIRLTYEDSSIAWTLTDVAKSTVSVAETATASEDPKVLTKVNQSVTYSSVMDGVDVDYTVTGTSVKENIILDRYVADFSLSFTYTLGNLTLALQDDGTYAFVDEEGKAVFAFETLYMYDAEGNDSQDIKLTVSENEKGNYVVTVTPDPEWLKTAAYPVTIDPTIYNPYYTIPFEDTYVYQLYPDTQSYYNYSYFYAANSTHLMKQMRGLLKFTLPSMTGKTLTYSYLTLYKYNSETTQRTIELHQNTSNFTESTVTWNTAPTYETEMVDYKVVNGVADTAYIFDITKSVREWVEGTSTNYGFTIKDQADLGAYTRFYSSEHWLEFPVVQIGFIDSAGIKDFWTYSSQDAGEAGTGYVSDYTGMMTWTRNDLSYSSERGSFGLTMVYNTVNRTTNIGYGLGWQTNYNMTVKFDTMVGKYYMIDATGSKNYFYLDGYIDPPTLVGYPDALTELIGTDEHGTCYEAEDGSGRILMVKYDSGDLITGIYVWNPDFSLYCFTQIVSNVYYLQYLESNLSSDNPYILTITRDATYPDRITMIKDNVGSVEGQGNYISIVYSSGRMFYSTLYLLTDSTPTYNPIQREYYSYTYCSSVANYGMYQTSQYQNYNGDGTLSFDQNLNYTYDSYGRITEAYETSGKKITYSFNSTTDRVTSISSYYSSSIYSTVSYTYGLRTTTVTDEEGNFVISKFDDYGHTVNLLDSQGTCQSFVYLNIFKDLTDTTGVIKHADGSPNYDNNHKLAYSSDPLPTYINPLENPNFEVDYEIENNEGPWVLTNGGGASADPCTGSPTPQAGVYCVKITTTSAATTHLSQTLVLDAGTYTISGYIYVDSAFSGDSEDAFILFVPNNNVYGSGSGSMDTKGSWTLVSAYFVVEADNTSVEIWLGNQGIGIVCFDSIQLTSGFSTTSGNLVENFSFEDSSMTGWGTMEAGVSRVTNTYDANAFASILGTYGIKIVGVGADEYPISLSSSGILSSSYGSTEGSLIIGGWAKSEGTPTTTQSGDVFSRSFRIGIYLNDLVIDDTDIPDFVVDFDSGIEGWQYNFITLPFDENTDSILLRMEYLGEGTVYFDNVQVYSKTGMTEYRYDPAGRTLSVIKPGKETTYSYVETTGNGLFSRIPTSITENGMTTDVSSDAEVVYSVTQNNVKSTASYNDEGQASSLAVGTDSTTYYTTSTSYLASAFNQYLSSSTDEYGNTTDFYYDVVTGLLEAIENASGQDTHYLFDEEGKLIEVRSVDDYTSATPVIAGKVAYAYDSFDRLIKICLEYSDPSTPTYYYEITYDDAGRMSSVKVNSVALMTYTYGDGATYHSGNVTTQTYANGDSMQFVYDAFDRVIEIDFWNGSAFVKRFTYEYDLYGRLDVYTEWNSGNVLHQEFYVYDGDGRISEITDEDGNETKYEYDTLGNVSKLTFVIDGIENITEYAYDSQSRISSTDFTTLGNNSLSRDYDYSDTLALERLNKIVLVINNLSAGLYTKHFIYQGNTSRISEITYDTWSDSVDHVPPEEYRYVYYYDELGNITQVIFYVGSTLTRQDNYEYDEMNQLIVEDVWFSSASDFTYVYSYDSRGNRTSLSRYGYQRDGLDPADYTLSYDYSQTWLDQLTANDIIINGLSETQNYVYDAQGNPTSISNFYYFDGTSGQYYDHATLTWEGRQLQEIQIFNAGQDLEIYRVSTITYTYNDQGYRTSKTLSEPGETAVVTTYDLLGSQVIHESNGSNDIYYTYDSDGTLISFNLDGEDYFCINNLQGDIVAQVDEDGTEVAKYEYDSYGNLLSSTGTVKSPLTYRGYRYDWEIGLFYLNSRYYNPQTGRFISSDGLLGQTADILSTNMYAYCANNPVNRNDPLGDDSVSLYEVEYISTTEDNSPQTMYTLSELYAYYLSSDDWEVYETKIYNDGLFEAKASFGRYLLGGLALLIPDPSDLVILSFFLIDGGVLCIDVFSIEYDWKSVTFYRKSDGCISRTFYVQYCIVNYENEFATQVLPALPWGVQ